MYPGRGVGCDWCWLRSGVEGATVTRTLVKAELTHTPGTRIQVWGRTRTPSFLYRTYYVLHCLLLKVGWISSSSKQNSICASENLLRFKLSFGTNWDFSPLIVLYLEPQLYGSILLCLQDRRWCPASNICWHTFQKVDCFTAQIVAALLTSWRIWLTLKRNARKHKV